MFRKVLIDCLKNAGTLLLTKQQEGFNTKTKASSFDLVTEADLQSEELITRLIYADFPDHNIIAEENKYPHTDSEYSWIIDPLDGTNNYSKGIPYFCVSIALAKNNKVIMGGVYNPVSCELFFAEKGKGAFLNDFPIIVSQASEFEKTILATGFYYDRGDAMRETLKQIEKLFYKNIIGIRRFGSAALDLCNVAAGRFDGYWELLLNPWDFAAGQLIVEEAGGFVSDRQGNKKNLSADFIIAANKQIYPALKEILN